MLKSELIVVFEEWKQQLSRLEVFGGPKVPLN
jgi:hypothetical protein